MNRDWHSFLKQKSAKFDDGALVGFSEPRQESNAAASATVLSVLSDQALLRVSGADAPGFLNSQLSNDLRRVDAAHSRFAAWCNPKGRAVTLARVFMRNDIYYLLLPADLRETVGERLRRFVLRAKVTIENEDTFVILGASGPQVDPALRTALPAVDDCLTQNELTALRVPGASPRYLLIAPVAAARALWELRVPPAIPTGPQAWTWLDIAAGIPRIDAATSEQFIPQMVNLEILDGVDFKKGCYPGQEIIARMQYLGRLKQRMYRVHSPSHAMPGTPVFVKDMPDQPAGAVVAAAAAPAGGYDLLAVLYIGDATSAALHLNEATGSPLQRMSLPYALPRVDTDPAA